MINKGINVFHTDEAYNLNEILDNVEFSDESVDRLKLEYYLESDDFDVPEFDD